MTTLQIPIVTVVIGEGGSGSALAIGVCDRLLRLHYSIYSPISPAGCAAILWKDSHLQYLKQHPGAFPGTKRFEALRVRIRRNHARDANLTSVTM